MIYISHRGNLYGAKPEQENNPEYIDAALAQGFDVEIDLWVNGGEIYLGHDSGQYKIDIDWLMQRKQNLWVHCKNTDALDLCINSDLHCFFHDTDEYTITSRGYVWAYPGKPRASNKCIMVMPERVTATINSDGEGHVGICSDYIRKIKMPALKQVDYNKHFVIATPLVGWKCDAKEHLNWMCDKAEIMRRFPNVKWFSAFELDHRGIEPFKEVIDALREVNGDYWTYSINDMQSAVTSSNRWIRIETGRNLIREFAQRLRITSGHHWGEDCTELNHGVVNYSAILYVDSDISIDADIIEKMLEVDRPLVGVDVPSYCLSGPVVSEEPRIEEHWTTAGALLVNAPAFYDLPWSHNAYLNLSDDPTFQSMAERLMRREGVNNLDSTYGMTWVRKDIQAKHHGKLVAVEERNIADRQI
jgi:hypothetical protein